MSRFFDWFNFGSEEQNLSSVIKSAVAHLYFVELHPFEDGNGRLARVIADMALSAEGFLFGLKEKEELGQQEKNEIIGLSLDEKYRQIYEILKDRGYDIPR